MPLPVGALLGPYEIVGLIGAGGMGEVYRAHDPRLSRAVAVKVLPASFSADHARVRRFEREAKAIGALNHPNIVAVYDTGTSDAMPFLVTELLDGQTLRDRLAAGCSVAQALDFAVQIAEGLAAAHAHGIVHRDLKPDNVFITRQGRAKILDFGLATTTTDAPVDAATQTSLVGPRESTPGAVLGTVGYMSPEQVLGKPVDHRSDVFSFGAVLFEMLLGQPPFRCASAIETMHAIIRSDPPDIGTLDVGVPRVLCDVVRRCLAKEPGERFQSASDLAFSLRTIPLDHTASPISRTAARAGTRMRRGGYLASAGVALSLLVLGAASVLPLGTDTAPTVSGVVRTTIALPSGEALTHENGDLPLAMSPDGSRIAFVAQKEGRTQLYVRELGDLEPRALAGTDGARHPFFSPDGESIAFFANGALQRVAIAGGAPLRICRVSAVSRGGSWGSDNTIVFASRGSDLLRVDAAGGTPHPLKGSAPAVWPEILPGGETVLFTTGVDGDLSAIATMPLGGGAKRVIARAADSPLSGGTVIGQGGAIGEARFVSSGHLLYGQATGIVRAMPFDLRSLSVTGSPVSVVDSAERAFNGGAVYFAVSQTGLLVYASTGHRHQLVWVDRDGVETPISSDRAAFRRPRVSPDGRFVAVVVSDDTRRSNVWVYDTERGAKRRLTTEAGGLYPIWTPDGSRITFTEGAAGIVELPATGTGPRTVVLPRQQGWPAWPSSWSPDGLALLYYSQTPEGSDLSVALRSGEPPRRLPVTSGTNRVPQFSPNGKWVAYVSDESGRDEAYVGRYPDLGEKVIVSTDGGADPQWARDGRELFFRQGDALMAAPVHTTPAFQVGKPHRLFEGRYSGESQESAFDVSPDGGRFVMVKSDEAATLRQLTVVQNWVEGLRATHGPK